MIRACIVATPQLRAGVFKGSSSSANDHDNAPWKMSPAVMPSSRNCARSSTSSRNSIPVVNPAISQSWLLSRREDYRVAIPCRTCGAEPRDGARFCDACGSPVATAESHAEYKQVTVLFADVVHSMDIAAALGAERLPRS